ncbi:DNA cytosine methyltransferase [Streptomyces europaeiscabiei]|uniref:DNA cytosine methyltransferase n=1 Tax=Streptomyces europaeiscabiei TaxID=146819 RepID=UPI002E18CAFF
MSRRRSTAVGATIPGTAVAPPRRTLDDVIVSAARPVPAVAGQRPLVGDGPLIGSFCTGYGGLDMAVQEVLGGSLAWVSDIDPGACAILAHRYPDVQNIGDLTVADWQYVIDTFGRPQIITGGYPCQPFSIAGELKGTADERHLWPDIARALRVLRPRLAFFENVGNHLRLGFDTVLGDLADIGFDAEWVVVRASDVGAPHERRRLFLLAIAQDADGEPWVEWRQSASRQEEVGRARPDARGRGRASAADPASHGRGQGRAESAGQQGRSSSAGDGAPDWDRFRAAVERWAAATGVDAPWATNDRRRLAPAFVEWMMGVPAGHVTAVPGLSGPDQLKALGNGVVRQQGAHALRLMLDRLASWSTAAA